jgi:AcrR family transcriptional regulator
MLMMDGDKITAVDLARKARVSRATLYRHYDSVDNVLCEMEDEFLEGLRECSRFFISAPFSVKRFDKPYPEYVAITEYFYKHKRFFLAVTGPHGDPRFVYKFHKIIREFYLGKIAYEGLIREDADIYVEFFLAAHDAIIRYWIEKRPDISSEKFSLIIQRILFGPLVCQSKS